MMKRATSIFAFLLALFASAPVHADLIKQSQSGYTRTFLLTQTANPLLGLTGATPSVKIRKQGGSYAATTNTATEVDSTNDPGRYQIVLTSTEVNTLGLLDYAITATSGNPESAHDQVVAFDPNDASLLGLTGVATSSAQTTLQTTASATNTRVTTGVPNAAPGAAGGLPTVGTGAGQINPDGTGSVPIAMGQTLPTTPTARTVGGGLFWADRQIGRLGTAQAGTSTTITLDSGASALDGAYTGHFIFLIGGTGSPQTATISAYVGATKVATISRPGTGSWSTTPDNTTSFLIAPVAQSNLLAGQSTVASNFVAAPTAAQNRAEMDTNSTQLAAINAQTTASAQQSNGGAALTAQGYTVTRAGKIDNLDATTSSRMASGNVTVGGYATGFDPATLLLLTPANKITTNGSGQVTTSNPASGSSVTEASIWAYGGRTLTGQTDSSGITTLLTRIPGVVQPQTGDAFARLGLPAGASLAADIAGVQTTASASSTAAAAANTAATSASSTATAINTKLGSPTGASLAADIASLLAAVNSNGTAIAGLPSASAIVNALIAKQILGQYTLGQIWTAEGLISFGAAANNFHSDTHINDTTYTISGSSSTLVNHTGYGTGVTAIQQTSRTSTFTP